MRQIFCLVSIAILGLCVSITPQQCLAQDTSSQEVATVTAPAAEAPAPAATTETQAAAPTAAAAPTTEKETARKPNYRRLPLYFPLIINKQQRSEVYRIQEEYGKQIADLEAQLRVLRNERDEKVMGILTPEQRQQYDDLKAKAKKSK